MKHVDRQNQPSIDIKILFYIFQLTTNNFALHRMILRRNSFFLFHEQLENLRNVINNVYNYQAL